MVYTSLKNILSAALSLDPLSVDSKKKRSSEATEPSKAKSFKQRVLDDDDVFGPKSYDQSEELFGLSSHIHPSLSEASISGAINPRSWFGPNGQYIRELPCPSCRGRGYTLCTECGIERSRKDCAQCDGKGMNTCGQCKGDRVIWEESIDERPWEKARSIEGGSFILILRWTEISKHRLLCILES